MPTLTIDDRRVHFLDEGPGDEPLVLIHTFPLSSRMWAPQLDALADDYRVIAPDLSGCGESDPPSEPDRHTIEAWADDVIALVQNLALERATLVGLSVGADVALAVTRRARESVGALLLASVRTEEPTPAEQQRWAEEAEWIAHGGDLDSIVDRLVVDLSGPDSPARAEVIKAARLMFEQASREGWIAGLNALQHRPDVLPDLHKIDVPTLIVAGGEDRLAPPDAAAELAARIPEAGAIEIPDAGHLVNMDAPALFTQAVLDVAAGREARRGPGKHSWPASPAITRTGFKGPRRASLD